MRGITLRVVGFVVLIAAGAVMLHLMTPERVGGLPPNEVETMFLNSAGGEVG